LAFERSHIRWYPRPFSNDGVKMYTLLKRGG
jgi:hypothetical protein